jgi:hypothetical protein
LSYLHYTLVPLTYTLASLMPTHLPPSCPPSCPCLPLSCLHPCSSLVSLAWLHCWPESTSCMHPCP